MYGYIYTHSDSCAGCHRVKLFNEVEHIFMEKLFSLQTRQSKEIPELTGKNNDSGPECKPIVTDRDTK